jgi:tetratricopeptide (TPR) repeat protein
MAEGSYYNAAQYLEDVYKEKPEKLEVPHLLGEANRQLRDYSAAEKYYKVVVDKDAAKVSKRPISTLAEMQKMNGKYEEAKKTFEAYLGSKS